MVRHRKVITTNKYKKFMEVKYLRWISLCGKIFYVFFFFFFPYNECLCRQKLTIKNVKVKITFYHHQTSSAMQFRKSSAIRKWYIKVGIAFAKNHNCHRKVFCFICSSTQHSEVAGFVKLPLLVFPFDGWWLRGTFIRK